MSGEQTYAFNPDGSITIKQDGKDIKYVRESDLLTVKGASEQSRKEYEDQIAKHRTEVAEANRVKDEIRQELLQERAAKEQLTKDAQEAATLRTKVGELESSVQAADTKRREMEDELLGHKRDTFIKTYKVDPEKVKGMDLESLREAEKHFDLVGFSPQNPKPQFDNGNGGGGGGAPLSPHEQAKQEIALAREQAAKKRSGQDPDYQA